MADTELFLLVIHHPIYTHIKMRAEILRLLNGGADINEGSGGYANKTVLQVAIQDQIPWLVRFLLSHDADPNKRNRLNRTPLHDIVEYNRDPTLVRLLLEKGADVDAINNHGDTPLRLAAQMGWVRGMEILLKHGADPRVVNDYGCTLVHNAIGVDLDNVDALTFVLRLKLVDVNQGDEDGNPPLHTAVLYSNIDAVKELIEFGADVSAKNNDGLTVRYITGIVIGDIEAVSLVEKDIAERGYNLTNVHRIDGILQEALILQQDRKVAVMSVLHPRLGAISPMARLDIELLRAIIDTRTPSTWV